jgi:hypothetical protein
MREHYPQGMMASRYAMLFNRGMVPVERSLDIAFSNDLGMEHGGWA